MHAIYKEEIGNLMIPYHKDQADTSWLAVIPE